MKWKNQKHSLTPPPFLLAGRETSVKLDGENVNVVWLPKHHCLQVIDQAGVEKRIRLRSQIWERGDDASQWHIKLQIISGEKQTQNSEMILIPDVPGQEARAAKASATGAKLRSQITGKVLKVLVEEGAFVAKGEPIAIIEAMKMENKVLAPITGLVKSLAIQSGQPIATGAEICHLTPKPD